eukprot:GILI01002998.1.p1 GENE.GILI01002998.1~~GILI01002998.1.p1  ORF type:complete len:251 (+),score=60.90 GILI01002998.1:104-856(+)
MDLFSAFLAGTHNRDKLLALVQYFPATVEPAMKAAGLPHLSERLLKLGKMADMYRIFTRFTVVTEMLEPVKMSKNQQIADPVVRRLTIFEAFMMAIHLSCEHLSYFSKWNILETEWVRWSRLGVIFWFYALQSMNIRQVYQLVQLQKTIDKSKASDVTDVSTTKARTEFNRTLLGLIKTILYTIFNLSLHPTGSAPRGQIYVGAKDPILGSINKVLALITPPAITGVTPNHRAALGLGASAIDFYLLMTK